MWEVASFTGLNNISTITDTASTSQLYIPPGRLSPDAQYTFTCQATPSPVLFLPSKLPLNTLAFVFSRDVLVRFYKDILVQLCLAHCRFILCILALKLDLFENADLVDIARCCSNVIEQQKKKPQSSY